MAVSEIVNEHIGWLKIYVEGMTPDNWIDMRLRCERQLNELTAALSDQVVVASPAQDVMDRRNKQFGFAWDLNEAICDAIDAGVTESRAIAARVTTDPRIKAWLPSIPVPASTPVRSS